MKLKTLKPRLGTLGGRVATLPNVRPDTIQRKRGSAGVRDREAIRKRDFGVCQACAQAGRLGVLGSVVDHIKPLWAGGTDEPDNKWLICNPCHDAKTAVEAAQRASGEWIG